MAQVDAVFSAGVRALRQSVIQRKISHGVQSRQGAICRSRLLYEQAVLLNPLRWTKGPRDWKQPEVVEINHPRRMQPRAD